LSSTVHIQPEEPPVSAPFPPHQDPTSPLFGRPAELGQAMTDVIVAPSTNPAAPWRYLVGYAHFKTPRSNDVAFSSRVVERAAPISGETDINEVLAELPSHVGKGSILQLTLMAGPAPIVYRVPVTVGPTAATHPYRYLLSYYGVSRDGLTRGFGTFSPDFDVIIAGPAHLSILKDVCARTDRYDPDKTHILGYTLLAGPAL
jgi:hypothetical protein